MTGTDATKHNNTNKNIKKVIKTEKTFIIIDLRCGDYGKTSAEK
jgi:hypothetical protein